MLCHADYIHVCSSCIVTITASSKYITGLMFLVHLDQMERHIGKPVNTFSMLYWTEVLNLVLKTFIPVYSTSFDYGLCTRKPIE